MVEAGIIEPSNSEWTSPVGLAQKKDGRLRFYIDYRRLNAVTKRDSYPIPRIDDCIDSLGNAEIFKSPDVNWGYWQIPLKEEDKEKTAFCSYECLYQFNRMPFGLMNAPVSFQRALDIILARYKWRTCLVYLDDAIVLSKNTEEHLEHVELVLTAWLLEIADPSGRLMRWCMRLAEFEFEILHKKESLNTQADAISRLSTKGHTTEHEEAEIPCLSLCDTYLETRKEEEVTEEPAFEDEAANSLDIIVPNLPDLDEVPSRIAIEKLVEAQSYDN
eukprot:IDg6680t1